MTVRLAQELILCLWFVVVVVYHRTYHCRSLEEVAHVGFCLLVRPVECGIFYKQCFIAFSFVMLVEGIIVRGYYAQCLVSYAAG